jgi:hypothetical protein
MPTYQLGAKYPYDYIGTIDDVLRFLPRPADYLFLYFLGFYGLLLVLKVDPLKASLEHWHHFSTYLIIILGLGIMQSACDCIHANGDSWFYFGVPKEIYSRWFNNLVCHCT